VEVVSASCALATVFVLVLSATAKASQPQTALSALRKLGASARAAPVLVAGAIAVEWAVAAAVALFPSAVWSWAGVLGLFSGFAALGGFALVTRRDVDCGCFGALRSSRLGWWQLGQLPVAAAVVAGISIEPPRWNATSALLLLVVLYVLVAAVFLVASAPLWLRVRSQRLSLASATAVRSREETSEG
jgi:hypothetical protein